MEKGNRSCILCRRFYFVSGPDMRDLPETVLFMGCSRNHWQIPITQVYTERDMREDYKRAIECGDFEDGPDA